MTAAEVITEVKILCEYVKASFYYNGFGPDYSIHTEIATHLSF